MNEFKELRDALNVASAQSAVMNLLVMALVAQAPDRKKLLTDFSQMSEDTTIRAMYSSNPESFFQAAQESVQTWTNLIRNDQG